MKIQYFLEANSIPLLRALQTPFSLSVKIILTSGLFFWYSLIISGVESISPLTIKIASNKLESIF